MTLRSRTASLLRSIARWCERRADRLEPLPPLFFGSMTGSGFMTCGPMVGELIDPPAVGTSGGGGGGVTINQTINVMPGASEASARQTNRNR